MSPTEAHNIAILGASGNIGRVITEEFLNQPNSNIYITVLTRSSSLSKTQSLFSNYDFSPHLKISILDDFTPSALTTAFHNQHTVISALATFTTSQQHAVIDAALAAGVSRFIPSEYGVDTSDQAKVTHYLPPALMKHEVVTYLRTVEDRLSWTAVITGAFFDWSLKIPGALGWDIAGRKALLVDGGEVCIEATNVQQIARAVVACVRLDAQTKNSYVYVNSFTVSQKQVLDVLERETGEKFEITHLSGKDLFDVGQKKVENAGVEMKAFVPDAEKSYIDGVVEMITAVVYGYGGLNCYSKEKDLWNEWLGLPKENLEETVKKAVEELGIKARA